MAKSSASSSTRRHVRQILNFTRKHDRFLVSGHVRSDADALGSQLAFHRMLRKLGKRSHIVCDRGVMPKYAFLPGTSEVRGEPSDLYSDYSAVFTFDSGSWGRLERIAAALPREKLAVVNVDHHASNERFGDVNWIDDSFSSSGEMVWEIVKASGVAVDRDMATCLYTAIVTDTGRFMFSNTTEATHRHAAELLACGVKPVDVSTALFGQRTPAQLRFLSEALQAIQLSKDGRVGWVIITDEMCRHAGFSPGDTQEYVHLIKSLKGVDVAVLLRELDGKVKVSFRTSREIDGVELASKWGGGGHRRASGASVEGPIRRAEKEIIRETLRFVREKSNHG